MGKIETKMCMKCTRLHNLIVPKCSCGGNEFQRVTLGEEEDGDTEGESSVPETDALQSNSRGS